MYTQKPSSLPGHTEDTKKQYQAHKCVADLRNTGKVAKVLVKYLHGVLHVYVDTQNGYKFCLGVQFEDKKTFLNYHIVFSAATGQVADNMDIIEVTTRYLAESDLDIDDSKFGHLGASSTTHRFSGPFWALLSLLGGALTAFGGFELFKYKTLSSIHHEAVKACAKFDATFMKPHYITHAATTFLLLFGGTWIMFLLNAAILGHRVFLYRIKQHATAPIAAQSLPHPAALSPDLRLTLVFIIYALCEVMYIAHLIG